jgi:hypothetical protein
VLVRDLDRLLKRTTTKRTFLLIDMFSLLPTDLLYFLLLHKYDMWPLIRGNRLLKFNRVLEFRSKTETSTNYPYFFRILGIYTFIVLIVHWNACIFFLLKKYFRAFLDPDETREMIQQFNGSSPATPINFYDVNNTMDYFDNAFVYRSNETFLSQYTKCFYRSTLQLTTISNIDPPRTTFERNYMIMSYLLGVLVFALIVGSVAEIIDDLNSKRRDFQNKVDGVKRYMQLANVDGELQERVIRWFNHSWSNNSGMDEQVIFSEFLPENLQAEIAINIHLETLKRVHIFQVSFFYFFSPIQTIILNHYLEY